jgi:CheY-like chemotaxis protein
MVTAHLSLADLRFALRHLYEPGLLQSNPLSAHIAPADEAGATSLRMALTDAIEALKPGPEGPPQSPARRAYEILYYRYVQQCTVEEVAHQVGLSLRHLKREHRKALERLAQHLSERYNVSFDLHARGPSAPAAPVPQKTAPARTAALAAVLPAVLALLEPMRRRHGVEIEIAEVDALPPVLTDAVTLRHLLLSVLCVALRRAANGRVSLVARMQPWHLEVFIRSEGGAPQMLAQEEDAASLQVAHDLASSFGAGLTISGEGPFSAIVSLPTAQRVPVLIVDDHKDALQLIERYLTDTRYRPYTARDAAAALKLAVEIVPRAIVLDVMMPEVDGWELLGRLKQHPRTGHIPVIACTILAQEELALSLGVSAFLRKPLNRNDLLAALDSVIPPAQK